MSKALIIADDFTGANDTGVQLKKNDIDVDVVLSAKDLIVENSVVLDTETRNTESKKAYKEVKGMLEEIFRNNDFDTIYKKIDSTLRGNISEEIRSVMELKKIDNVIIAPAYPRINRITKNSVQFLNGKPLLDTEIVNDPLKPIWTDNIERIIRNEFDESISCYTTEEVENINKLNDTLFHIFDVTKMCHLEKVKALTKDSKNTLYVGSAGLAEVIFKKDIPPVLSVIGSISETSLNQIDYASKNSFNVITIKINDLVSGNIDKYISETIESLNNGNDTIVTATREKNDYKATVDSFIQLGVEDRSEISNMVKGRITEVSKKVLTDTKVSGVFLTGGDTAISMIEQLGAKGCRIEAEILPGVVKSFLIDGPFGGLPIVTKAGAFGDETTVVESSKILKGEY